LNKVQVAIVGGAAVHVSVVEELQKVSCLIYATYGMTETVSHIALRQLNGGNKKEWFTTLPTITVEKDNRSCLVIHIPELKEPIVTNDMVDLIDANHFTWIGRWDTIINSGGVKISPEKIESILDTLFTQWQITQPYFATGIPDEQLGQKVVLVMEGDPLEKKLEQELLNQLTELLPKYENPKAVLYVPKFNRTETGKINRIQTLANL
jgi:O-succinylbenzoic acid--CoA ligase